MELTVVGIPLYGACIVGGEASPNTGNDMSMLGQPWQKCAHSEWFLVRTANLCISLVQYSLLCIMEICSLLM